MADMEFVVVKLKLWRCDETIKSGKHERQKGLGYTAGDVASRTRREGLDKQRLMRVTSDGSQIPHLCQYLSLVNITVIHNTYRLPQGGYKQWTRCFNSWNWYIVNRRLITQAKRQMPRVWQDGFAYSESLQCSAVSRSSFQRFSATKTTRENAVGGPTPVLSISGSHRSFPYLEGAIVHNASVRHDTLCITTHLLES